MNTSFKHIIFFLSSVVLVSCNEWQTKSTEKKPEIVYFKPSACQTECFSPDKVQSRKIVGDTLILRLSSIENCVGKFVCDMESKDSILNILIKMNSIEIIKNEDGSIDTVWSHANCDCFFYYDLKIINLPFDPATITVNGYSKNTKERVAPEE